MDDVNVESFEVSFINSDGNQSPFLVRFWHYFFICFIFILTGYQSIVVKRYYLMYCKNANVKLLSDYIKYTNIHDFSTQPFDSDEVASLPESDDVVQVIIRINKNESAVEPAETRLDVRICGIHTYIYLFYYCYATILLHTALHIVHTFDMLNRLLFLCTYLLLPLINAFYRKYNCI